MNRLAPAWLFALVSVLGAALSANAADAPGDLLGAFTDLTSHVNGVKKLSDADIGQRSEVIEKNKENLGKSEAVIRAAIGYVAAHDASQPFLFKEKHNEFGKDNRAGLRWTVFQTMQYLLDFAYTAENLAQYPDLLGKTKFATADYFPGPVAKPADPHAAYTVKVWGNYPHTPAYEIWIRTWTRTARIATGAYVAPGTIVTVTVPQSIVNKGYQFRVGANTHNFERRPNVNRLFRVSLLYPVNSTTVQLASPLGGLINLEVPIGADAGAVELKFENAVRAPLFVNNQVHQTTNAEWVNDQSRFKAPWAEFQTQAFFIQLPRTWVYNMKDPVGWMNQWDKAVTAVCHVMGYKISDLGQVGFYLQPDTQLKASVFSPGYPQTNVGGVLPGDDKYNGLKSDNYYIKGPGLVPDWVFHEWGHELNFTNPAGEMESSNNYLHVVAQNLGLGIDLDKSFSNSRGSDSTFCTLDHTAVHWMTNKNFPGGVMAEAQKAYQLQGHAKYVDVARLFGWESLANFYRMVYAERSAAVTSGDDFNRTWPKNVSHDFFNLRLSETTGVDMRPLFAFWGTPPTSMVILDTTAKDLQKNMDDAKAYLVKVSGADADTQRKAQARLSQAEKALANFPMDQANAQAYAKQFQQWIESGKLKRSAKIYDQLVKYKGLVPPDNSAYRKFALAWYTNWKSAPDLDRKMFWAEKDHAELWGEYTPQTAEATRAFVQRLIDTYFPDGRPKDQ